MNRRPLPVALLLAGAAMLPAQDSGVSFTDACTRGSEDLVLEIGLRNPALALRESARYLHLDFGSRVLERLARAAPDEAVDVLSGQGRAAVAARETLLEASASDLRLLARLSADRSLAPPTRRRVAVLFGPIAGGRLTEAAAVKLAGDTPRYFAALADARVNAAPADTPAFDRAIEIESRLLCRAAADSGGRAPPREMTSLRARDLYLVLAFGRTELEGPVFAAIFDRLLLPALRAEKPAAASLRSFLAKSKDWALRDFAAASAAAHRLDAFLPLAGAGAVARLALGIDAAADPPREAVRVAEAIASSKNAAFLRALSTGVLSEFDRCSRSVNAQGRLLYGLLAARLSQIPGTPPPLRNAGSAYLPFLASAEHLDLDALFGENGDCFQRYFFYDDEDGVNSFNSFLDSYRGDPKWTIEDHRDYVRVFAAAPSGRRIEIFANRPLDSHLPANRGREFEAEERQRTISAVLDARGATPAIFVHRGHSFYVSRTVKQIANSARLVVLGSCGGVTDIAAVIQASHDAQVIATRGVGAAEINDPLLKSLNDRLLSPGARLEWSAFWQQQKGRFGGSRLFQDYIAPNREPAAVFLRAYYLLLDAPR